MKLSKLSPRAEDLVAGKESINHGGNYYRQREFNYTLLTMVLSLLSFMAFLSCALSLQNCKPWQRWSSNKRCLAQNFPEQWLQEPTIRNGGELQEVNEHLFFFFVFLGAGLGVASVASLMRMTASSV